MPGIFGRKQQSFVLLSRYTHPFLLVTGLDWFECAIAPEAS
jgi:hypothetical protein